MINSLMPKEISKEEIAGILPRTLAVTVKRTGNDVKFKLRTKKTLFTIKATPDDAAEVEKIINGASQSLELEELD